MYVNVGELPDTLFLLSSLQYLDLYNNQIYGPVPESYKKLQELRYLIREADIVHAQHTFEFLIS